MAVKKTLMDGYSYKDMFDIQDSFDNGLISESLLEIKTPSGGTFGFNRANKDNFGSLLGQTDALAAFKKRKLEQQKMAQAGVGAQQSILGGGAF